MFWEYKSMFIVIYAKFWVGNDLAGWLGDVSTSSKRPQKVEKFIFFVENSGIFGKHLRS